MFYGCRVHHSAQRDADAGLVIWFSEHLFRATALEPMKKDSRFLEGLVFDHYAEVLGRLSASEKRD